MTSFEKKNKREDVYRRLALLKDFLYEHTSEEYCVSAEQILRYWKQNGVEVDNIKTVYKALNILKDEMGMKIEYNYAKKGYQLAEQPFKPNELRLMIDSIQSANFITEKEAVQLSEKVKQLADVHTRKGLDRKAFVDNRIHNMKDSVVAYTDIIYKAIDADEKIEFRFFHYTSGLDRPKEYRNGGKPITVSPFALYWSNGFYYLYAYTEDDKFKYYRIDRMEAIAPHIGMRRKGKDKFRESHLSRKPKAKIFDMYGGAAYKVRMRCSNAVADYLIDKFGKDIMLVPDGAEHFTVNVDVEISPTFYAWAATFGHLIQITNPPEAVEGMKAFIADVYKMYED